MRALLLGELAKVKAGNFPDWLIPAIINNEKLTRTKSYESNEARASAMYEAFIERVSWKDYLQQQDDFGTITKAEIVKFANDSYGPNFVTVFKRTGIDPNKVKVVKPAITPVPANRDVASAYYKQLTAMPSTELEPVFVDYKKDIQETEIKPGLPLYYTHNAENGLFNLYYVFDLGNNQRPALGPGRRLPAIPRHRPVFGRAAAAGVLQAGLLVQREAAGPTAPSSPSTASTPTWSRR